MNLRELNRDRQLSEVTGEELCEINKKIDEFFDDLFNGMTAYQEEHSIKFIKSKDGNKLTYMEHVMPLGTLWVTYNRIWRFLSMDIELNRTDIQSLIQSRVEEQFNMKVGIPGYKL